MGWNTWNKFWCGINETLIHDSIDALIEIYDKNKMEKLEYIEEYINKSFTYVDFKILPKEEIIMIIK